METETLGIQLCLTGFFYYEQTQALNWDKYCSKLGMIKGRKTPGTGQLEDRTSPRRNGTNSHSLTGKSDNRCCIHLTFYPRITTYIYSLNEKNSIFWKPVKIAETNLPSSNYECFGGWNHVDALKIANASRTE